MARKKAVKSDKCPSGHKLPKEGCTPLFCVTGATALAASAPVKKVSGEYEQSLTFAKSRNEAREALVPAPNLTGAAAEEYVEEKKVALLPQALAEVEFQLRYGDNKERAEAARDVLRMNGMLNRDAPTGVAPTVIINMGDKQALPWLKRKEDENGAQITPSAAR